MGNQTGKERGVPMYDPSKEGTRETIASWHRYGVDVWDVYEFVDDLGQGDMGPIFHVRRKERSAHNEITRQKTVSSGSREDSEPPKPVVKVKPTPKLNVSIKKALIKSISGGRSVGKTAALGGVKEPDKLDVPPKKPLAIPPKAPSQPKPILKASHYSNPTNEIPDVDDESEEEDSKAELVSKHWNKLSKDRVEHIAGHRTDMLDQVGTVDVTGTDVLPVDPLSAFPKVAFKRHYACKTVLISLIKGGQIEEVLNAVYIMRSLDHPYIIKLYEVYQVKRKLWLIMELCTGGDLTSRKLREPEVVVVVEQILRALAYMHRRGVVHRDLKLENVLYEDKKPDATIRLIDFGLSQTYDRAVVSRKTVGTAYTMPPEIASKTGTYTDKSDIWALGVCAWILLAGDFPFIRTEADLDDKFKLNRLINAQYKFGITWTGRGISKYAKAFVDNCLRKNPNDRWTAKDALDYIEKMWLPAMQEHHKDNKDQTVETVLNRSIAGQRQRENSGGIDILGIQRFCKYGPLKKTILITMAHTMDRNDVGQLNELFLLADTEDTGTLNLMELKNALRKLELPLDDKEIEDIFKGIDQDRSGEIHYMEFLAALAESQGLVTMERLAEAFDRLDSEGKGYISHDDLKMVLGKDYDKDTVDRMIKEGDFKLNNQVDYEELLRLMFEDLSSGMDTVGNVTKSLRTLEGFEDITTNFRVSKATDGTTDE